jgi:prepilin signal peptidase PulO-like enzyme (type II secretory pathway)
MAEPNLPFYGYVYGVFYDAVMRTAPDFPPEAWWVPMIVIGILAAAAFVDAFTSSVPDPLIFVGLLAVTACQGMYISWPFAATQLSLAIAAGVIIWGVNQVWLWSFKQDAIGMGDAKWSMLAVSCFGVQPVLIAWGFGACLAILWIAGARLARYQINRVYFAPFLFLGLLAGMLWVR